MEAKTPAAKSVKETALEKASREKELLELKESLKEAKDENARLMRLLEAMQQDLRIMNDSIAAIRAEVDRNVREARVEAERRESDLRANLERLHEERRQVRDVVVSSADSVTSAGQNRLIPSRVDEQERDWQQFQLHSTVYRKQEGSQQQQQQRQEQQQQRQEQQQQEQQQQQQEQQQQEQQQQEQQQKQRSCESEAAGEWTQVNRRKRKTALMSKLQPQKFCSHQQCSSQQ
uniref:Uncharacterized protein n=1 Tax=Anopheles dirus TaxID=7168 RepID=A0A182N243_9DIPT